MWQCRSTISSCFFPVTGAGSSRSSGRRSATVADRTLRTTVSANRSAAPVDRQASLRARRRHSRHPTPPPSRAASTLLPISPGESAKAPHPSRTTSRHMSFLSSAFLPPSTSTTGRPLARISRTVIIPGLVMTRSCSRISPAKSLIQPLTSNRSSFPKTFFKSALSSSSRPTTAVTRIAWFSRSFSTVRIAFRRREFTR